MNGLYDLSVNLGAFLGVLLLLVLVHELGHFATAKLAGVKVLEFGFGYPPRLIAIKYKGTDYSVNLLPLGGFVKLLGEEDPSGEGSLASKNTRTRLTILAAGPLMNALLPVVLLSASLMLPHQVTEGPVHIIEVASGSPAYQAGLLAGDVILKMDGREVKNIRDVGYNIQLNLGSELAITVQRGSDIKVVRVSPRWNPPAGQGATGIVLNMPEYQEQTRSFALPEAVGLALRTSFDLLSLFRNGIYATVLAGSGPAVTGPIGIAQATGEIARAGIPPLLEWAAFLSMNLAILNILPIPALDGGRMLFVLVEWVRRGRRIPPEREALVHLIGMAVLMALMLVITFFDIERIRQGESLFR